MLHIVNSDFNEALIKILAQIRDELIYKNLFNILLEGYKSGFLSKKEYGKAFQMFKEEYEKEHSEKETASEEEKAE